MLLFVYLYKFEIMKVSIMEKKYLRVVSFLSESTIQDIPNTNIINYNQKTLIDIGLEMPIIISKYFFIR